MSKRVHEIAKERGLPTKEVIEKLKAAGVSVKAASSSVDEATAARVFGNGDSPATGADESRPARTSGPKQPGGKGRDQKQGGNRDQAKGQEPTQPPGSRPSQLPHRGLRAPTAPQPPASPRTPTVAVATARTSAPLETPCRASVLPAQPADAVAS